MVIWLGVDGSAQSAVRILPKCAQIPRDATMNLFQWSENSDKWESPENPFTCLPCPRHADWIAIDDLVDRDWFKSAWVRQKCALAKYGAVLMGQADISWDDLIKGTMIISVDWLAERVLNAKWDPLSSYRGDCYTYASYPWMRPESPNRWLFVFSKYATLEHMIPEIISMRSWA